MNWTLGAVALHIGIAATAGIVAQSDSGYEVRVRAMRLTDGRTEFEDQQRNAGGEWSDSLFASNPRLRADPTIGRWYSSRGVRVEVEQPARRPTERVSLSSDEYPDLFCDVDGEPDRPNPAIQELFGDSARRMGDIAEEGDSLTNGRLALLLDEGAAIYVRISAPPEYREYHSLQTALLTSAHATIDSLDPAAPFEPLSLFAIGLVFGALQQEVEQNLTPQAKGLLEQYGCEFDDEEDQS